MSYRTTATVVAILTGATLGLVACGTDLGRDRPTAPEIIEPVPVLAAAASRAAFRTEAGTEHNRLMRLGESRFPAARARGLASGRDARCVMVVDLLTSERTVVARALGLTPNEYEALRTIAESQVRGCEPSAAQVAHARNALRTLDRAADRDGSSVSPAFDGAWQLLGQRVAQAGTSRTLLAEVTAAAGSNDAPMTPDAQVFLVARSLADSSAAFWRQRVRADKRPTSRLLSFEEEFIDEEAYRDPEVLEGLGADVGGCVTVVGVLRKIGLRSFHLMGAGCLLGGAGFSVGYLADHM